MRPRALVTGGAARVGRAICLELAQAGWDVRVHYRRSEQAAAQVVRLCREAGAEAVALQADLGEVAACVGLAEAVKADWDHLDLLVNNASIFEPRAFADTDLAHWDAMLDVNLRAPFLLSRELLSPLQAAKGTVVNLCDIGAERPLKGYTAYSVSKAGLVMLTRSMAVELAPEVRTMGVSPGQVAWPEDYSEAKRAALTKRIPQARVGRVDEVAALVRFLATEGTYLNGVVVPVDGGLSVRY